MTKPKRTLDEVNERRRKVRRILMYIGIPFLIATIVFGAKVVSMNLIAKNTFELYTQQSFSEANLSAERQKIFNVFEGYKAYYNSGTTMISLAAYDDSIAEFKTALGMTKDQPKLQCDVRANLAVAYEKYGDSYVSTDKKKMDKLYESAKKTIAAAHPTCRKGGTQSDNSMTDTEDRIEGKQQKEAEQEQEEVPPTPDEEQIEEIQDQSDGSAEDRTNDEQDNPMGDGTDIGKPPVEKPW